MFEKQEVACDLLVSKLFRHYITHFIFYMASDWKVEGEYGFVLTKTECHCLDTVHLIGLCFNLVFALKGRTDCL